MTQINIAQAKTGLSKLIKKLEAKKDDAIYISKNGLAVAKITLVRKSERKRIGAARGEFSVPDNFDAWDEEISGMFEDKA